MQAISCDKETLKRLFPHGLLFLLIIIAYSNTLGNSFVWDDYDFIVNNPRVRNLSEGISWAFMSDSWGIIDRGFKDFHRPVVILSYVMDYQLWGLNPVGFHITNIFLHLITTVLVYLTTNLLPGKTNRIIGLFTAMLFAVHPIHTEAVSIVTGRTDVLCGLFFILTFYLFMKQKMFLSILSFVLALLSKEMAFTLPFILTVYVFFFRNKEDKDWRLLIPFFVTLGLYLLIRIFVMENILGAVTPKTDHLTFLFTVMVAAVDYIRLLIVPYPLVAYYPVKWYTSFTPKVILSFFLLLALFCSFCWLWKSKKRDILFPVLWVFLTIIPVLNINENYSIAERYLYIPSIGTSVFAGILFRPLWRKFKLPFYYVFSCIVVLFIIISISRNTAFKDNMTLYRDTLKRSPDAYILHNEVGALFVKRGELGEAKRHFKKAIDIKPGYLDATLNLSTVYLLMGEMYEEGLQYDKALNHYYKALQVNPYNEDAYNYIGIVHGTRGEYAKAIEAFQSALRLNPGHKDAKSNLKIAIKRRAEVK